MDGEEGSAGFGGGADGSGYGVGDVVEFEIEEDVEAAVAEFLDDGVAGGVVEFHADFVPTARLSKTVYKFQGLMLVGYVERDGEAVFGAGGICG
jgi:hypothetical protein